MRGWCARQVRLAVAKLPDELTDEDDGTPDDSHVKPEKTALFR
jgi:hypothetical protein